MGNSPTAIPRRWSFISPRCTAYQSLTSVPTLSRCSAYRCPLMVTARLPPIALPRDPQNSKASNTYKSF